MHLVQTEPADLAFFFGADPLSRRVARWTSYPVRLLGPCSGPTHVGVLCPAPGRPTLLYESTTMVGNRWCLISGEQRHGCQAHLLEERISDYVDHGGRVEIARLNPDARLEQWEALCLLQFLERCIHEGRRYDTAGAIRSATWTDKLLGPDDHERLYCSEYATLGLQNARRIPWTESPSINPFALYRRTVWTGLYQVTNHY